MSAPGPVLQQQRVEALGDVLAVEAAAQRDDHLDVRVELGEPHLRDRLQLGIELGVLRARSLLDEARDALAEELLALGLQRRSRSCSTSPTENSPLGGFDSLPRRTRSVANSSSFFVAK